MHSQKVAAVILAAGASSRFGKPKQLLRFQGKTLVRHAIDAVVESNCSPVIVVVGSEAEAISREFEGTSAEAVENKNWQHGIGSSIRMGVQHLLANTPETNAILLLVADQPFVNATVISQLITLFERANKPIVAASYSGTIGVPALFARECFQELLALADSSGAKSIILSDPNRVTEFSFPQGAIDIDTVVDWKKLTAE